MNPLGFQTTNHILLPHQFNAGNFCFWHNTGLNISKHPPTLIMKSREIRNEKLTRLTPPSHRQLPRVLITCFDKILITVSRLTKNNGRVIRPLQYLTYVVITCS